MRIDDRMRTRPHSTSEKTRGPGASRPSDTTAAAFARALEQQMDIQSRESMLERLDELRQELDNAGKRLDKSPTLTNYHLFMQNLKSITELVQSSAYRVVTVNAAALHEVVLTVDEQADELYQMVMAEQKDRVRITHQIMRIQGLVINMLS